MIGALSSTHGPLTYLLILVAAIVEGELLFAVAATLVSQGQLHWLGVIVAGAIGGSIGDQFYFYALRGRLRRWLERWPSVTRRGDALVPRVRRHETLAVIAIRFVPGLRIALSAACAYAGVRRLKFSVLSLVSSLAWASGLMALIAWAGPAALARIGVFGWWAAVVPAVVIVLLAQLFGATVAQRVQAWRSGTALGRRR